MYYLACVQSFKGKFNFLPRFVPHSDTLTEFYDFLQLLSIFLILAQQPPVGQDLLIHEVSRSHATTHYSR
jgi:hypothetical protein